MMQISDGKHKSHNISIMPHFTNYATSLQGEGNGYITNCLWHRPTDINDRWQLKKYCSAMPFLQKFVHLSVLTTQADIVSACVSWDRSQIITCAWTHSILQLQLSDMLPQNTCLLHIKFHFRSNPKLLSTDVLPGLTMPHYKCISGHSELHRGAYSAP